MTRCPCCDGSCERDAREILRGRGAAHGSVEALGKTSVVCIGDSITSGVGASRAAATYPGHLQRLLGDDYIVTNLGACGAAMQRCSDLPYRRRVQWEAAQRVRADIVVVMLGTNDARPPNWDTPARALDYEADYRALVHAMRAGGTPAPEVYVAVPPPFYGPPGAAGAAVEAINSSVKAVVNDTFPALVPRIVRKMGLSTEPIRVYDALGGSALSCPDLFPDGVHPNDDGYLVLARTVLQALRLEAVPPELRREELHVAPGAEPRLAPTLPGQPRQQQQQPALSRKRAWAPTRPVMAMPVSLSPRKVPASVSISSCAPAAFVPPPDVQPGHDAMPMLLAARRRARASTVAPHAAGAAQQAHLARSRSAAGRGARQRAGHHRPRHVQRAIAAQSHVRLSGRAWVVPEWAVAVPVAVVASR